MTGALQSVGIVVGTVAVFGPLAWWLMTPERVNLGPKFVDATPEAKRWTEKMRTAEIHGKAVR